MTTERTLDTQERTDLIETLDKHRSILRHTVTGLNDEQARQRSTVSELCLGGLIKHVAIVERRWADFIVSGPVAMETDGDAREGRMASFRMSEGETLSGLLEGYDEVARRTDELVRSLSSLDASQPLPKAPWFKPGAEWSARRVLLHVIAETAQHAGHADILREAIDGAKTMG